VCGDVVFASKGSRNPAGRYLVINLSSRKGRCLCLPDFKFWYWEQSLYANLSSDPSLSSKEGHHRGHADRHSIGGGVLVASGLSRGRRKGMPVCRWAVEFVSASKGSRNQAIQQEATSLMICEKGFKVWYLEQSLYASLSSEVAHLSELLEAEEEQRQREEQERIERLHDLMQRRVQVPQKVYIEVCHHCFDCYDPGRARSILAHVVQGRWGGR
jgi:hypothetical protein